MTVVFYQRITNEDKLREKTETVDVVLSIVYIFSLCSIFIHYFVSSAVLLRQLDITENMLLAQLVIDICTSSRYYILEL